MATSLYVHQSIEWIVLTKAPVAGLVKTRLIPELGKQGACDVYCDLLSRLERVLKHVVASNSDHVALWVAGDINHEAFNNWVDFATFYKQPEQDDAMGVDLGMRMAITVKSALSRGRIPVLIGVDVPNLDEPYLMNCLQQLKNHDVVISPAEDGGYGLLGMKQFHSELFNNKQWGTDSVFNETRFDLEKMNLQVAYLPKVWDVDEPADVKRFRLSKLEHPHI